MNRQTLWRKELKPGGKWSGVIGRGRLVRFTARGAGANLAALLYNADHPEERYNMPDTLKAQHTARLTKGHVLMSDNGRVLASIVEDTLGWHDPLGALTTRGMTDRKYGRTTFQDRRNDWLKNGLDNAVTELVRHGLGPRDLVPPVNFFSKVRCDAADGRLHFVSGHAPAGASVALRTEMNVLLVLSNTPHPLDPAGTYPSVPVEVEVAPAEPVDPATDVCVNLRDENRRAFENTWEYFSLGRDLG